MIEEGIKEGEIVIYWYSSWDDCEISIEKFKSNWDYKNLISYEKHKHELDDIPAMKARIKKTWPDSYEEALKISPWWGFEEERVIISEKYLVVKTGKGRCIASCIDGLWCYCDDMTNHWKNNGELDGFKYKFIKFDSREELLDWFSKEG